ncbi:hypothetical protein F0562_008318 [Nyssa sinensis]|uniref:Uncharacterized protein n=1 Tax=Nyssa sinensis TaxID=561372 RepID=A0A5J5A859_9ASTE|nr:hypothetical protein F0562_008318 [Nyssa sinensis]
MAHNSPGSISESLKFNQVYYCLAFSEEEKKREPRESLAGWKVLCLVSSAVHRPHYTAKPTMPFCAENVTNGDELATLEKGSHFLTHFIKSRKSNNSIPRF